MGFGQSTIQQRLFVRAVGQAQSVFAGRLTVEDHTQMLVYQDARGHWVVIQAPTSLGWDDAQLAGFAAGVIVLHNARPGHG